MSDEVWQALDRLFGPLNRASHLVSETLDSARATASFADLPFLRAENRWRSTPVFPPGEIFWPGGNIIAPHRDTVSSKGESVFSPEPASGPGGESCVTGGIGFAPFGKGFFPKGEASDRDGEESFP